MSYTTGTANDMGAVRQALIDACVADGWSWDSATEVLGKGTIFVRLSVVSGYLKLWGRISAGATGEQPVERKIGPFTGTYSNPLPTFSWPVQVRLFTFPSEVYCVIQYAVDTFQWLAFGKSTVAGLPGCGTWAEGSSAGGNADYRYGVSITFNQPWQATDYFCPAPFWAVSQSSNYGSAVHNDLDGHGWGLAWGATGNKKGIKSLLPLIGLLPNRWNSEALLLPIRAHKERAASKISLVADLEHARFTRIDNYDPCQIVSIGTDRWMLFPFFRKNMLQRDGGDSHTGTHGWAIRYEWP